MNYERLADIVREEIQTDYVPNACILAARLTTVALRRFGIMAEPMAVELEAFSPAYVEMLHHAHDLRRELTHDEVGEFAARGAWRVSVVTQEEAPEGVVDNRDGGYRGHVIILAEDRHWLIDPTLPQVARPGKGLAIEPPYAWEIDYEKVCADGGLVLAHANGTHIIYTFQPDRRDFRRAPDWRLPGFRAEMFDDALHRVINRVWEVEVAANH